MGLPDGPRDEDQQEVGSTEMGRCGGGVNIYLSEALPVTSLNSELPPTNVKGLAPDLAKIS